MMCMLVPLVPKTVFDEESASMDVVTVKDLMEKILLMVSLHLQIFIICAYISKIMFKVYNIN